MATSLTPEMKEKLQKRALAIFKEADKNGDGVLSRRELKALLHKDDELREQLVGNRQGAWKVFWNDVGANDNSITSDELVAYITKRVSENEARLKSLQERAREIFVKADKNADGSLSHKELKGVMQKDNSLREELGAAGGAHWHQFWEELDADKSGTVESDELVAYCTRNFSRLLLLGEEDN